MILSWMLQSALEVGKLAVQTSCHPVHHVQDLCLLQYLREQYRDDP